MALLNRVTGDSFVQETKDFFGTFADLLGHFRARGLAVGKLLRDPRTVFLIVCAPDRNRIAEAKAIDQRLAESGCRARAFIVNRVESSFLPEPGALERSLDCATALLGAEDERDRVRVFLERLEAMRVAHQSAAAAHAEVVAEVRGIAGTRPVYIAPRVPAGQSPRASLLAVYLGLFAHPTGTTAADLVGEEADAPQSSERSTDGA
jgi:anion-transporting  ArsA/GET3 family ATPase